MQQAAVVPEHGVADRPPVMIDTRRLAGMVHQRPEQLFGFGRVHSRNAVRVTTDQQRLAPGLGMRFHQGAQRRVLDIQTIAVIVAAFFSCKPDLFL